MVKEIYQIFFNDFCSYDNSVYVEGTKGNVTINNGNITILDADDNYIVKDVSIEKLKKILEAWEQR